MELRFPAQSIEYFTYSLVFFTALIAVKEACHRSKKEKLIVN